MEKRNVRNWICEVAALGVAAICGAVICVGAICFGVIFMAGAGGVVRGQEAPQPPVPSSPPVTPNPGQTAPAAPHAPATASPTIRKAMEWKRFDYTCEGGAPLAVYLHNQTVKVSYKDKLYLMRQVPAADGGRYSDGKVVWWSKGNGGFLQADSADGDGAMMAKDCKLDKPMNASETPGTVSGTVTYMVRMALPPEAVVEVQLQDVSRTDAKATVIAEEKITVGDRQVPIPFELKVEPGKIEPSHTYAVRAEILVDGQIRFTSEQAYNVLTKGNPAKVEIVVKPVGGEK
jgi:uncharacterized lipoprotein YbaY